MWSDLSLAIIFDPTNHVLVPPSDAAHPPPSNLEIFFCIIAIVPTVSIPTKRKRQMCNNWKIWKRWLTSKLDQLNQSHHYELGNNPWTNLKIIWKDCQRFWLVPHFPLSQFIGKISSLLWRFFELLMHLSCPKMLEDSTVETRSPQKMHTPFK